MGVNNNINSMRETALENLAHDLELINERIHNFISKSDFIYNIFNLALAGMSRHGLETVQ
jgi:hypothetical protein